MKLRTWQKVFWWLFLVALLSAYLANRGAAIVSGQSVPVDVFVFLVWSGLLLAPLFNEVSFFGLKFKQEIEHTRQLLSSQISLLESRIQNPVAVSPQFNIGATSPVPNDAQLAEIKDMLQPVLANLQRESEKRREDGFVEDDPDLHRVEYLLKVRFVIEREIRRLYRELTSQDAPRTGALRILPQLVSANVISGQVAFGVTEVFRVCSPAIHAEYVTDTQISFVKEVSPQLLASLRLTRIVGGNAATVTP
jgi:hypothetical protein